MQQLISNKCGLDYFPCRYGASKVFFRGPRRRLEGAYAAFIGGTETYGKFVEMPFPAMLEVQTGLRSVNLGSVNAGIDLYFNDQCLLDICSGARLTVIQVMGAANLSNRFYSVHPRRNDRFVSASSELQALYPEVDFTEVSFTRHLLSKLAGVCPGRFKLVVDEVQTAWTRRMRVLMTRIAGPKILLWLSATGPQAAPAMTTDMPEPILVSHSMLADLEEHVGPTMQMIEVVATADERARGLDEMFYSDLDLPAAKELLGPVVHRRVCKRLGPVFADAADPALSRAS